MRERDWECDDEWSDMLLKGTAEECTRVWDVASSGIGVKWCHDVTSEGECEQGLTMHLAVLYHYSHAKEWQKKPIVCDKGIRINGASFDWLNEYFPIWNGGQLNVLIECYWSIDADGWLAAQSDEMVLIRIPFPNPMASSLLGSLEKGQVIAHEFMANALLEA